MTQMLNQQSISTEHQECRGRPKKRGGLTVAKYDINRERQEGNSQLHNIIPSHALPQPVAQVFNQVLNLWLKRCYSAL